HKRKLVYIRGIKRCTASDCVTRGAVTSKLVACQSQPILTRWSHTAMTRPELIQECSRRFGKRAWLGATNGELEACLADGAVPLLWASGRRSAADAAMAGSAPAAQS